MIRCRVASLALCVALFLPGVAMGQDHQDHQEQKDAFRVQVEPMWMGMTGNALHQGDTFRNQIDETGVNTFNRTTFDSIKLEMDDDFTVRTEASWMRRGWGFGVSGWWFGTDDEESGLVTNPAPSVVGEVAFTNGVRMWDVNVAPMDLDANGIADDEGLSSVIFEADSSIDVWTIDINAIRTLAETRESRIDLTFGLKLGGLDNDRGESQSQSSVDFNDLGGLAPHRGSFGAAGSSGSMNAETLVGPVVGFAGHVNTCGVRIEGNVNQSVLIGDVDRDGIFLATLDNFSMTGLAGGPFTPVALLSHDEIRDPFDGGDDLSSIPVTELKIKISYDVTPWLSIGLGFFTSVWWDAPLAPEYSAPDSAVGTVDTGGDGVALPNDLIQGPNSGWMENDETLIFYGGMVGIEVRF